MKSNTVRVTRDDKIWYINAGSAKLLKDVCQTMGWEFDTFTDWNWDGLRPTKWQMSELIQKIGTTL